MVEFQSIEQVKDEHLKNLKGIIVKESDLKAGTYDKKDWIMKIFTFEDKTGQLELACFNDEIKNFLKGHTYEVENFYWKDKSGTKSASLGQYAKVKEVAADTTYTSPAVTPPPEEKPVDWTPPEHVELPKPSPTLIDFVQQANLTLLQIEGIITLQHAELGIPFNGQHIGLHTKEIYEDVKKTNLIKASKMP